MRHVLLILAIARNVAAQASGASATSVPTASVSSTPTNATASATSTAEASNCEYDDSVSEYISCQKDRLSTTQLIAGGIGFVLGIALIGFAIVWLLNRRKNAKVKAADGGEKGEGRSNAEKVEGDIEADSDGGNTGYRRQPVQAKPGPMTDSDSDSDSDHGEKSKAALRKVVQPASRQAQQASVGPQRGANKQEADRSSGDSDTDDADDSEDSNGPAPTQHSLRKPSSAAHPPAPSPNVKRPGAAVTRIPRTASPSEISEEGSPVDRHPPRQLYPSNPSPDPHYLQRKSYIPDQPVPPPGSLHTMARSSNNPNRMSVVSARFASRPDTQLPQIPSATARAYEGVTRPLTIRKASAGGARQPSLYEPSSRPIKASSAPDDQARRPSASRTAEAAASSRRPSEPAMRRPSEARPSLGGESGRKGSQASARRPSERAERI